MLDSIDQTWLSGINAFLGLIALAIFIWQLPKQRKDRENLPLEALEHIGSKENRQCIWTAEAINCPTTNINGFYTPPYKYL